MKLNVAIQMDPIHAIDIGGDSTFALALTAQERGHTLFYYEPRNLSYRDGRVFARGHYLSVRAERGNHYSFQPEANVELSEMHVVLLRLDPPYARASPPPGTTSASATWQRGTPRSVPRTTPRPCGPPFGTAS